VTESYKSDNQKVPYENEIGPCDVTDYDDDYDDNIEDKYNYYDDNIEDKYNYYDDNDDNDDTDDVDDDFDDNEKHNSLIDDVMYKKFAYY
jgi:hypothetical protein